MMTLAAFREAHRPARGGSAADRLGRLRGGQRTITESTTTVYRLRPKAPKDPRHG